MASGIASRPLTKPVVIPSADVWDDFNSNYSEISIVTDSNFVYLSGVLNNFSASAKSNNYIGKIKEKYRPNGSRVYFPIISDNNYDVCGHAILNGGTFRAFYIYPSRSINDETIQFSIVYPIY
ncbi:MAG: hypothetical protein IJI57_06485 [Flexilinea sp.]|nr:hypothetical protein [Flexilinea sp.]